jgi:hypothetical protein
VTYTTETDNLARGNHVVPTEFAQQLERERDEARKTVKSLRTTSLDLLARLKKVQDVRDRLAKEPSAWTIDWQAGPYPDTMRVVLATDGEIMYMATYTKHDGWQDAHTCEDIDYYITYWAEMPALPQV